MSTLYLPLRSNAAWFRDEDSHDTLRRRFKNFVLFHDSLTVEDGRYRATFVSNGSSDNWIPPEGIIDRSRIQYRRAGAEFGVRIAPSGTNDFRPLIGGPVEAAYEVDFWPILAEAGIASESYVQWFRGDLTRDGQQLVRQTIFRARLDPELESGLPENSFLRSKVVESLYRDAAIASRIGLPLSVDAHASSIIARTNASIAADWDPDVRSALQNAWLSFGLPDAGSESWDTVVGARESAAGKELREVMGKLSDLALEGLTGAVGQQEWNEAAQRLLVQEIVAELLKRRSGLAEATINFGLNFIPVVGAGIGTAKDLWELVSERRSWVSLLAGFGQAPRIEVRD